MVVAMSSSSPGPRPVLNDQQLDDLQTFIKEWLRHAGRTQADLRRALRASSIRMPALIEELRDTYDRQGLAGLAERLCGIEERWQEEGEEEAHPAAATSVVQPSLGSLDLLLEEIRQERQH
jgi:hypothetical protein